MFNDIRKFRILLNKNQKFKILIIFVLMLMGAVLETLSVSLILPLVSAVVNPDIMENQYVRYVCDIFDLHSLNTFMVLVIISLILLFILKNLFLLFEYYVQYRFVYNNRFAVQKKLMNAYLHRPYEYFLHATTAEISRVVMTDTGRAFSFLTILLGFFTEAIISGALIITLFIVDPFMTILVALIMVILVFFIARIIKPILKKAGLSFEKNYALSNKWLLQSISGVKELKVVRKENFFLEQYSKYGERSISAEKRSSVLDNLPRLMIETFSVSGMLAIIGIMIFKGRELSTMIPQLSAFAMAAVRLMPSVNRLSSSYNSMSYLEPSLDKLLENLQDIKYRGNDINGAEKTNGEIKNIHKQVELKNITYVYPKTEKKIFDEATMVIPIGKSVGIVGTSGAGKTTAVDILLGLLEPQQGQVLADGIDIRSDYHGWLSNLGYIPQMIFMLDDTIRANVAFGYARDEMDDSQVWRALEEAQIAEFVRGLPKGLDTEIGERGVRISGGQRQRLGIARALYNDPKFLIFDEATSALDNETEAAIIESIHNLHGKKTMVIIAHRLTTIEGCDIVYRVEDGKILLARGI